MKINEQNTYISTALALLLVSTAWGAGAWKMSKDEKDKIHDEALTEITKEMKTMNATLMRIEIQGQGKK